MIISAKVEAGDVVHKIALIVMEASTERDAFILK
jgi:hypothetical protein